MNLKQAFISTSLAVAAIGTLSPVKAAEVVVDSQANTVSMPIAGYFGKISRTVDCSFGVLVYYRDGTSAVRPESEATLRYMRKVCENAGLEPKF